jgi:hypothetical protein
MVPMCEDGLQTADLAAEGQSKVFSYPSKSNPPHHPCSPRSTIVQAEEVSRRWQTTENSQCLRWLASHPSNQL